MGRGQRVRVPCVHMRDGERREREREREEEERKKERKKEEGLEGIVAI